uniref:Bm9647 n=1 Tax=Brugia malayi TaxID=6279 RepID=A0A1I9G1R9_BRUMA|nr:Bm9647 [Brugia malayi]
MVRGTAPTATLLKVTRVTTALTSLPLLLLSCAVHMRHVVRMRMERIEIARRLSQKRTSYPVHNDNPEVKRNRGQVGMEK